MKDEPILGIDLGTTNSCIAIWKNRKVEVIPDFKSGNRIIPSIVGFIKNEILIGYPAKNQLIKNYKNTIINAKRLIGKNFNDTILQQDMKYLPFKIINSENKPKIEVEFKGKKETYLPEQILGLILTQLKHNAKAYLGYEINKVIITCPAYFNDLQRQATKDAGKIVGLNVVRIINEPTAAAIAYGFNKGGRKNQNILIFDLGGGTFDVTILNINGNNLNVISTCGDTHLGGEDFDNCILKYCINEFKNQTGINISNNQRAIIRLKVQCEKAKIHLSSNQEAFINIDALAEGEDFDIKINRSEFEELCKDYFNKLIPIIEKAIKDGKLTKDKINEIILVGGSTRIPKITEIIKKYFNKDPIKTLQPDEAVAIGAAIQGAIINNTINEGTENFLILKDVTPLSLGLELSNGEMDILIPRNTKIPCKKEAKYRTVKENQKIIKLKMFQGERKLAKENKYLGQCIISDIPPRPKGGVLITVVFEIDENGSVIMSAIGSSIGKSTNLKITMENVMNKETIDDLILKAKKMEYEDIKSIRYKTRKDIKTTAIERIDNNNKYSSVQLSLGIEILTGEMIYIIKRDSPIPVQNYYSYITEKDYQSEFLLKVYQGERLNAKRNFCLKTITIKIPSKRKGEVRIDITFILNNSNLLKVIAKVIDNYSYQNVIEDSISISTLDEDDVEDNIAVAQEMREDDKNEIETKKSKLKFENYVYSVKYKVDEMMEWIEEHKKEATQTYIDVLKKFKEDVLK